MSPMNFQIEKLRKLPVHEGEIWQGGLIRMPGWVEDDKKPYRPWMAIWISVQKNFIHTSEPQVPGEENFSLALGTLVDFACNQKLMGCLPEKIEVKDSALAEHMGGMLAELGVKIKHRKRLPLFDQMLNGMAKELTGGKLPPNATDVKGVGVEEMKAFAEAACQFYQARPWQHLTDEDLIEIEAPFVDESLRYVTVMGCGGQTFGLSFFESQEQYESLYDNNPAEFFARNKAWSITFDPITQLPFGDADLWEDYNLPVAGEEAYPFAACFSRGKWKRPGPDILAFMEGLLKTLAETREEEIDSGRWQKSIKTFEGQMEFKLALPSLIKPLEKQSTDRVKFKGETPDQRVTERDTFKLQKLLEGYVYNHCNDFNDNNTTRSKSKKKSQVAFEEAQDLIYQAFETRGRRQLQLARKALEICPDCADAYVLLAERTSDVEKAHDLYLEGVLAGERALGKEFFKEEAGHFWDLIETRPYMRARQGLAQCLEAMDIRRCLIMF